METYEKNITAARKVLATDRLQGDLYKLSLAVRVLCRAVRHEDVHRLDIVSRSITEDIVSAPESFAADDSQRIRDAAISCLPKDLEVHCEPTKHKEYYTSPLAQMEQEAAARRAAEGK